MSSMTADARTTSEQPQLPNSGTRHDYHIAQLLDGHGCNVAETESCCCSVDLIVRYGGVVVWWCVVFDSRASRYHRGSQVRG